MDEEKERIYRKDWFVIIIGILMATIITLIITGLAHRLALLEKIRDEEYLEYRWSYLYMSSSEIESFNSTFTSYRGIQKGSQVKALIQRLKANARTYSEEPEKIPCVSYNTKTNQEDANEVLSNQAYGVGEENRTYGYLSFLEELLHGLNIKGYYYVVFTFAEKNFVRGITINYVGMEEETEFSNKKENFRLPNEEEDNLFKICAVDSISTEVKEGEEIKAGIKYSVQEEN